jgi:hypothetical protein
MIGSPQMQMPHGPCSMCHVCATPLDIKSENPSTSSTAPDGLLQLRLRHATCEFGRFKTRCMTHDTQTQLWCPLGQKKEVPRPRPPQRLPAPARSAPSQHPAHTHTAAARPCLRVQVQVSGRQGTCPGPSSILHQTPTTDPCSPQPTVHKPTVSQSSAQGLHKALKTASTGALLAAETTVRGTTGGQDERTSVY